MSTNNLMDSCYNNNGIKAPSKTEKRKPIKSHPPPTTHNRLKNRRRSKSLENLAILNLLRKRYIKRLGAFFSFHLAVFVLLFFIGFFFFTNCVFDFVLFALNWMRVHESHNLYNKLVKDLKSLKLYDTDFISFLFFSIYVSIDFMCGPMMVYHIFRISFPRLSFFSSTFNFSEIWYWK